MIENRPHQPSEFQTQSNSSPYCAELRQFSGHGPLSHIQMYPLLKFSGIWSPTVRGSLADFTITF